MYSEVILQATEVPFTKDGDILHDRAKPYLFDKKIDNALIIINHSLFGAFPGYKEVDYINGGDDNVEISYDPATGLVYITIHGGMSDELIESFQNNYGDAVADTWMEGDVNLTDSSELNLDFVEIRHYE